MRFTALAAAACGLLLTGAAVADADVIKYRQNNMKALGAHMQSVVALVRGEVDHADHLAAHARALADMAGLTAAAFKAEASSGDSTAKAGIWAKWDDFAAKSEAMKSAADKLAAAAAEGDQRAVRAAVGELGRSCKSCHDAYREKR